MAAQRLGPTVSPRKITEASEIRSGLTKKIATASASGIAARPRKKQTLAKTTQSPRRMWSPSRFVRSDPSPPEKGTMKQRTKIMPMVVRISTI